MSTLNGMKMVTPTKKTNRTFFVENFLGYINPIITIFVAKLLDNEIFEKNCFFSTLCKSFSGSRIDGHF